MAPDQVPPNNFPNTLANRTIRQYARGMTTSPEAQRDELAEIIEREEHYYDTGSHYELSAEKAAAAILAAGYRKPRTIETVEELEALPDRAIVKDRCGPVERHTNAWSGERGWFVGDSATMPHLPATLIWEPEAEATR